MVVLVATDLRENDAGFVYKDGGYLNCSNII